MSCWVGQVDGYPRPPFAMGYFYRCSTLFCVLEYFAGRGSSTFLVPGNSRNCVWGAIASCPGKGQPRHTGDSTVAPGTTCGWETRESGPQPSTPNPQPPTLDPQPSTLKQAVLLANDAMRDMFEQVEEWWAKSDLLACCQSAPIGPRGMHPPELQQNGVLTAGRKPWKAAPATIPRRRSSAPDNSRSIVLRNEQHKLEGQRVGVNNMYTHLFTVPSSHHCSFVFGRISHNLDTCRPPPRQLHGGDPMRLPRRPMTKPLPPSGYGGVRTCVSFLSEREECERNRDPSRTTPPAGSFHLWSCGLVIIKFSVKTGARTGQECREAGPALF